jgi:hypothetical protein
MNALLGLVGALIGAGAALAGIIVTGRRERRLAHEREVRLAVADHAKALGSASHSIQWLVWKARFAPRDFSVDNLLLYDHEIHAALAGLVGSLAVIAALDLDAYRRLQVVTDELYVLDDHVSRITASYRERPDRVLIELDQTYEPVMSYHRRLNQSVAEMFAI